MNLIIDIGNTLAKLALFNNEELVLIEKVTHEHFVNRALQLIAKHDIKQGILSSVILLKKEQIEKISKRISLLELQASVEVPFKNNYRTPNTLGVDRIALIAAAVCQFPNQNVLVIDAGTCITYDFVNSSGEYFGGAISPGIQMRYNAMHTFTSKLPQLELLETTTELTGNSTVNSMHSGVVNGVIGEIDNFVRRYKEKNGFLTVVLTGGDINFLANKLKIDIFAQPNFLLVGLNAILIHNNQ